MLRSAIPIGRIFGVDLRLHISFPLLLVAAVLYSILATGNGFRGFGLWIALCLAVTIREVARAIVATYDGLRVKAIFLLPVGGIMALAPPPGQHDLSKWPARSIAIAGPAANFICGLTLLAAAYAVDPHVSLFAPPWVSAAHVLRSFVWTEFILGTVGLLPASMLTSQRLLGARRKRPAEAKEPAPAPSTARETDDPTPSIFGGLTLPPLNTGSFLALAMIVGGLVLPAHLWLVMLGFFLLLYSQISSSASVSAPAAETITVREAMLTEFTLLSTTDTLGSALDRASHSLQDVFPVVRGNYLVGSVARSTLVNRLMLEGDSYLQGVMTRALHFAHPEEKLGEALRRSAALGASEFIPVVDDGSLLGILTPQSLSRAVQHAALLRAQHDSEQREAR